MNIPAIEIQNLCKTFSNGLKAVDDMTLSIPQGTVYGMIGRNGAGKTTTIRLLMGLLNPDSGYARIVGHEYLRANCSTRSQVTYVPQVSRLPSNMTLNELCTFTSGLYPFWDHLFAKQLKERFELNGNQPVGLFSGGEQQKAAILLAFAARPRVVLLDEPAASLDPIARRKFIDAIVDLISDLEGCTILFSTHILSDLERIAEKIGIVDRGRMVMDESIDELKNSIKRVQIIFPGEAPPDGFRLHGALRFSTEGPVVSAVLKGNNPEFESLKSNKSIRINEFSIGLEDLFIELLENDTSTEVNQ
jgi:ABC-2 type transport system ATP-binding protein